MVRNMVWWTLSSASAVLSIFFLFLGISLCRASFHLGHPHQFILTFFASNLIILISVVIIVAVIIRVIGRLRHGDPQPAVESSQLTPDSSGSTDPIDSTGNNSRL